MRKTAHLKLGKTEGFYAVRANEGGLALRSIGEVARILGCSRQAVHQCERRALFKLRSGFIEVLKERNPALAAEIIAQQEGKI